MPAVALNPRLIRIFRVAGFAAAGSPKVVEIAPRFRNAAFFLLVKNSAAAPVVTVTPSAVRPEAPDAVENTPAAAGDKIAFGAAIPQAGDGLNREERGDVATQILPARLELDAVFSGTGSCDFELWAELKD